MLITHLPHRSGAQYSRHRQTSILVPAKTKLIINRSLSQAALPTDAPTTQATSTSSLLSPLPPQHPSGVFVDRSGLVSQRRIRTARTPRMLALPAFSAPLKVLKAKGTRRTPVSTPRARWRNPVVLTPAMLALATDRHTSRLPKSPAPRDRRHNQARPFRRIPQPTPHPRPSPAPRELRQPEPIRPLNPSPRRPLPC
jgi:hypothetical protein